MTNHITQLAQEYVDTHFEEVPYGHGLQKQTAITEKEPSQEANEIAEKIFDLIRNDDEPSSITSQFKDAILKALHEKFEGTHPSEFVAQTSLFMAEMQTSAKEKAPVPLEEYKSKIKDITDRMYMQSRQEAKEEIFFQEAMPLTLKAFDDGLDLETLLEKARRIFFIRLGSTLPTVELPKHTALALAERIKNT